MSNQKVINAILASYAKIINLLINLAKKHVKRI